MPIITLTTDWNSEDFYVGLFKGKILSRCLNANIVDITHRVKTFNTTQAAFIIRNSYSHFPRGTIHVVFVNTEPSDDSPFLVVKANGHYFIGTDNGIFDLIINNDPDIMIRIDRKENDHQLCSYSAFDVFANAACELVEGKDIKEMGVPVDSYIKRTPFRATIEERKITGQVIYIDSFNNAITNITRDLFERVGMNRPFEMYVKSNYNKITSINNFYHQSPVGELLAIFNSAGLLEIAINSGSVARLLNLDSNSLVRIEFKENKI